MATNTETGQPSHADIRQARKILTRLPYRTPLADIIGVHMPDPRVQEILKILTAHLKPLAPEEADRTLGLARSVSVDLLRRPVKDVPELSVRELQLLIALGILRQSPAAPMFPTRPLLPATHTLHPADSVPTHGSHDTVPVFTSDLWISTQPVTIRHTSPPPRRSLTPTKPKLRPRASPARPSAD